MEDELVPPEAGPGIRPERLVHSPDPLKKKRERESHKILPRSHKSISIVQLIYYT